MVSMGALPILPTDTTQSLHDALSELGAKLMVEAMETLESSGQLAATPQDESLVTYAHKLEKSEAAIDHWLKDIAPSTGLRKWFGHDPARWVEFRRRYMAEIEEHREELDQLRALMAEGRVTLVYSAHDEKHNDAVVLEEMLLKHR